MSDSIIDQKLYECLLKVKSYLMKIGASKEDAEDIVQETAYKFILYIDSVSQQHVESWLYRVAVNGYYDLYRKGSRRQEILQKFNFYKLIEEETPEVALIQSEAKKDIESVMKKLKPRQQQLLLMKYSMGLAIREIGALVEMKEQSVKTNLYRARQDFIQEYRRQGHE